MKKLLLLLSVTFMVGCTGINIQSVFNSLPQVQELLAEHPDASFVFTYWTSSEINETIDDISFQCEKNMVVQDMYFARVSEGNVEVSAWFDSSYNPLCVVRKDVPEEIIHGNESPSDDHDNKPEWNGELILKMEEIEEGACVKLKWTPYPWTDLKYYKVVRSTTNNNPKYPQDSHIKAITSRLDNTLVDCPEESGKYYYGITMVASDDEKHYTNPVDVYIEALVWEEELVLEYAMKEEGECVKLEWTPYPWSDFKYYKVVRSTSNNDPKYPEDGYISVITSKSQNSLINCPTEKGVYYYGITMVSESGEKCYSNPVSVEFDWHELIEFDVQLIGELVEEGECVRLDWLAWPEEITYYKVVKSITNPDPKYPEDGYLECIENRYDTTYFDCELGNESPIYYRITTVRTDYSKIHSNIITIDNSSPE